MVTDMVEMVAIGPHKPPATASRKFAAPASAAGMVNKMIGVRPSSICHTLSLKMPHNTAVGQSGPPHKMATFAIAMRERITCNMHTTHQTVSHDAV